MAPRRTSKPAEKGNAVQLNEPPGRSGLEPVNGTPFWALKSITFEGNGSTATVRFERDEDLDIRAYETELSGYSHHRPFPLSSLLHEAADDLCSRMTDEWSDGELVGLGRTRLVQRPSRPTPRGSNESDRTPTATQVSCHLQHTWNNRKPLPFRFFLRSLTNVQVDNRGECHIVVECYIRRADEEALYLTITEVYPQLLDALNADEAVRETYTRIRRVLSQAGDYLRKCLPD